MMSSRATRRSAAFFRAIIAPVALTLAGAAPAPVAGGAPIEVAVNGVRDAKGNIHVDVCLQKQFLTSDCLWVATAPARAGTTIVIVPNVPPGRYAVQAFHDRNGNGKVDRGLFGIPKEAVGFSNDAPTPMRPPHFEDAAFEHGEAPQHIAFTLRHFLG